MVTFPSGLLFTSANTQVPFSQPGVFGLVTHTGNSLSGGTVIGVGKTHNLVPLLIGRRRLATVFA